MPTHNHFPPPGATLYPCWDQNLSVSYLHAGERGQAVLLLHGWAAFKELWWSTLQALAPNYRAFALDLPGHGSSPLGVHRSIADLARTVEYFCAAHRLERIVLVGHSMGGAVAAEVALQRPDLVERLVLVDAAIDAHRMPTYIRAYLWDDVGWSALRFSQTLSQRFSPVGAMVPNLHGGGWLRPWLRRSAYVAKCDPAGLRHLLHSLINQHAGERLANLAMPTLVVSGQFDALVPLEHSRRTARLIPGARFVVIPGALHNPMDERPAAFERELLAFLD